jgi:quercetin dioxygenase-like cupin family protein
MDDFPPFMKVESNAIAASHQSPGIKGWLYESVDGKQMAYWICEQDGVSAEHRHEFDEYFVVLQGTYVLIINDVRIELQKGDEYFIPHDVPHSGEFWAGTRTIHCFGGTRIGRG